MDLVERDVAERLHGRCLEGVNIALTSKAPQRFCRFSFKYTPPSIYRVRGVQNAEIKTSKFQIQEI